MVLVHIVQSLVFAKKTSVVFAGLSFRVSFIDHTSVPYAFYTSFEIVLGFFSITGYHLHISVYVLFKITNISLITNTHTNGHKTIPCRQFLRTHACIVLPGNDVSRVLFLAWLASTYKNILVFRNVTSAIS